MERGSYLINELTPPSDNDTYGLEIGEMPTQLYISKNQTKRMAKKERRKTSKEQRKKNREENERQRLAALAKKDN